MDYEEVDKNIKGLTEQAERIFGFEVVNNWDWTHDINVIDFLRDYGKYFNINYMLAKDKVKSRLESGITYAEFSYMILQALDFMYLYASSTSLEAYPFPCHSGSKTTPTSALKCFISRFCRSIKPMAFP